MQIQESEITELKSTFGEWKEIITTLCAFANKNGGTVIVGLDDNAKPVNLQIGKNTIEEFVNKLRTNTDPVLYPSINRKTFALGEIVEINIPKSDYKPVFAFGRAYTRVGRNTIVLSANEIRNLSQIYTLPDFDKQKTGLKIGQFNFDNKLVTGINKQHFNFPDNSVAQNIFSEFGVIKDSYILNAGYLCFVKENIMFSNAHIKAARFKGDTPVSFIDMQEFTGNIINAVDETINFIKKHINMSVIIDGKPAHTEMWEYPLTALREAIINAVVHRDYTVKGNIQIRIFDNSLEIWSPGLLPKEIDIANIMKTNRSIPRNQLLADIFHELNYIEAWGTGLLRIIELSKQYKLKQTLFEHIQGAFVIKFIKNEGINKGINKGLDGGINEGLNSLLRHIKNNPGENSTVLARQIDKPQKTVERWLAELKKSDKIIFKGSKKTGGYFIKNS
jgi:ATP-dependent DNA helicase RecG